MDSHRIFSPLLYKRCSWKPPLESPRHAGFVYPEHYWDGLSASELLWKFLVYRIRVETDSADIAAEDVCGEYKARIVWPFGQWTPAALER